mmetsp:Transcript_9862/g.20039  ORF Transcript_9862/g.20039 Transcript_9862/m.20039 type:complete len:470 (-) Transcript_9862:186-1595(-)
MHDAVGVDVKCHLDLGHAARGWRDSDQVELPEQLVVRRHVALALQHFDPDLGLVVGGRGELLGLFGGDRGVAGDEAREDATKRLDAERQRRHVDEQNVLDVALEHAALDRGAHGHHLVGVDTLRRVALEELLHRLGHLGHAGHAADQQHLVDVRRLQPRVLDGVAARLLGPLNQLLHQRVQSATGHLHVQMLRARGVRSQERKVDVCLRGEGELALGLLSGLTQTLDHKPILGHVEARVFLELVDEVLQDRLIEVLSSQVGVSVGGLDLEHALVHLEDGHIKGPAAKIVHSNDLAALLLVHAVRQRRRRWLVDDAQNLQARDLARVLGRLTLRVVEVCRHCHHSLVHGPAQVGVRRLFHLEQHVRADLRRRVLLPFLVRHPRVPIGRLDNLERGRLEILLHGRISVGATDESLGGVESVLRVCHSLALSGGSNEHRAVLAKRDHGRRCSRSFSILDHPCFHFPLHDSNT